MDKSFRLYTGVLKAWEDASGEQYVSGTTSSTIVDLQGDEITLPALELMRLSALANMTLFLNHEYKVPEDLFGSVTDARIVKRVDADPHSESFGKEVHDLDITIKVSPEDENPRAQKTYRAIQRGRKLGLSIGAEVTKASTRKNAAGDEIWVIEGVALRESSVVGIPANQRSYMHNALKALKGIPESTSEAGIDRELEEKGLGDRLRAGIAKNEAAAVAVAAGRVSDLDDIEVVPAVEVIVADENVSDGFEGLDTITNEVVAAVAAATEDDPAVTEDEPVLIEAAASVPLVKGWVPDPGDDALGYTYLLESVLSHLSQCDDPEDMAVLQGIAVSVQSLIAREIAEIAAVTPVEMAAAIPLIQKALDAATTSKREAVDLRKQLTTATAEKAQVEELLSKALEHLSSALALPVGRKSAVTSVIQAAAPDFPWLAPAVAARVAKAS